MQNIGQFDQLLATLERVLFKARDLSHHVHQTYIWPLQTNGCQTRKTKGGRKWALSKSAQNIVPHKCLLSESASQWIHHQSWGLKKLAFSPKGKHRMVRGIGKDLGHHGQSERIDTERRIGWERRSLCPSSQQNFQWFISSSTKRNFHSHRPIIDYCACSPLNLLTL